MRSQTNVKKWFMSIPTRARQRATLEAYKAELATYTSQAHKERQEYLEDCINTMTSIIEFT